MKLSPLVNRLLEKTKTGLKKSIIVGTIPIILGASCAETMNSNVVKEKFYIELNKDKPAYAAKKVSRGFGAHEDDVTIYQMPIRALFCDFQRIDTNLNFEYTMKAFHYFWQSSSPIKEVNHRFDLNFSWYGGCKNICLDYAKFSIFDHKSNGGGKGGVSRGFDRHSLKLAFSGKPFDNTKIKFEPNIFKIYRTSTHQRDLEDYMGFWEAASSVEIRPNFILRKLKFGAELNFGKRRWGTDLKKGNQMYYLEIGFNTKYFTPNIFGIYENGFAQDEMTRHNRHSKYGGLGLSWDVGI